MIALLFSLALAQGQNPICPVGLDVAPGQFGLIPLSSTATQADHLVAASNDDGHVFVVWHSNLAPVGAPKQLQAEGCLLWRNEINGTVTWRAMGNHVLGDPTKELWQNSGWPGGSPTSMDSCIKPTVVSVGSNFLVTWPRVDVSTPDRLFVIETVLIETPATMATPTVIRLVSGEGFRIPDPVVPGSPRVITAGNSGETLGATRLQGGSLGIAENIGAVTAIHSLASLGVGGVVLNNYALYGWEIDFSNYQQVPAPVVQVFESTTSTMGALIDEIHVDRVGNTIGGRVPPFVRETKTAGGLVVSYDVMESQIRPGVSVDEGKIMLSYFTPSTGTPGMWDLRDEDRFQSAQHPDRYHRRSNISVDFDDLLNEDYSVAWLVIDPVTQTGQTFADATGSLGAFEIDTASQELVNVSEWPNYPGPVDTIRDSRTVFNSTTPTQLEHLLCTNDATPADGFEILAWDPIAGTIDLDFVPEPTCTSVYNPRRPAAVGIDGPNLQQNDPLVIVFDARIGSPTTLASPIFFVKAIP